MTLVEQIHRIYDRGLPPDKRPPCIYPFIGKCFQRPAVDQLRILGVGINAYSVGNDFGRQPPELYGQWFEKQMYRYQRGVWRDLRVFGTAITQQPSFLTGLRFEGRDSIFLTNAVKVYVKDTEGKKADQLNEQHFKDHLDQWRDELDVLAESNVLPHVVTIIGDPFWKYACDSFRSPAFKSVKVIAYRWCKGPSLHFANRLTLEGPHGRHEMLLVRLRHPAGRAPPGSPTWLLEQPDFLALASDHE